MKKEALKESVLHDDLIFRGKVFTVHHADVLCPENYRSKREWVEHHGGVAVLAINEQDEVYFVEQYRIATGQVLEEIPAGKLEKGEEPLAAAQRELSEECGLTARHWQKLGQFWPTPGYSSEMIHLYLAEGLEEGPQHPDPGEFLHHRRRSLADCRRALTTGELTDGKTLLALSLYFNRQSQSPTEEAQC